MEILSEVSRAIAELSKSYYKVLKVNLTTDEYEIVRAVQDELGDKSSRKTFSAWTQSFGDNGCVYEADQNIFSTKLNLDSLRSYFRRNEKFSLRYRRLVNGEFRWVYLEILRHKHYTHENQVVWLFVKDVHDNYVREMENQRELERFCKYDTLTGLNNFYSYQILCKTFAEGHSHKGIGVIFADLNGLKLINDTRGHDAGNEFLKTFSSKVLTHFNSENIYRISGDEFLIIQFDEAQDRFEEAAEKFQKQLESEPVPQASIGFCWKLEASHIEDVTRKAEIHMYESKERFYEKHPEYKRGIAELNYKREMDAILKTLANAYNGIATVDLRDGSLWLLKLTSYFDTLKDCTSFSDLAERFQELVDPEYLELLNKGCKLEYIQQELKSHKKFVGEFKMKDGQWFQLTFRPLDTQNDEPTKAILILEKITNKRIQDIERTKDLLLEHQIIEGLSLSYSLICHIKMSTKKVIVYRNNSLKEVVATAINTLDYDAVSEWFIQKFVVPEDQSRVSSFLDFENVKEKLKDRDVATLLFRTTPEFHNTKEPSYSQFQFNKIKSDPDTVILATKNVTKAMG